MTRMGVYGAAIWVAAAGMVVGATGAEAQNLVAAQELTMPSGLTVTYQDRILEQNGLGETWLTLRFVSPRIGRDEGEIGYEQVAGDLDRLCNTQGLPAAAENGDVDQVIITLMDRVVERGVIDHEATMFIGAYLPTTGGCVWQ